MLPDISLALTREGEVPGSCIGAHRRVWLPAFIAMLLGMLPPAFAANSPPTKPVDIEGWRALTLRDVEAMHALLRDQTIVPFDEENPAYPRWLEEGYLVARARAVKAADAAGHFFTLRAYANGFHDPHFSVSGETTATRWPGFIVAQQGGKVVVVRRDASDPAVPALGAVIERCDGLTPSQLVQQRLSPYLHGAGRPERLSIPFLFQDMGNPFEPLPATCQVRTGDQVAEIALQWREVPFAAPEFVRDMVNATGNTNAPWGLTEPAPGVFWIGVPTFVHSESTAASLRALIASVEARGDEMRKARAIVIDTRGNGGGNPVWPYRLANAIFTPQVMKAARDAVSARHLAREVRATAENVETIGKSNVTTFRMGMDGLATEPSKAQKREDEAFLKELKRAIKSKPPVLRMGSQDVSAEGGFTAQRPKGGASPFPARVYFLSNGSCGSICLDFADAVLKVPGVRLIGSETGGDTPYTAIRRQPLPSGLATLNIPMMAIRGRGRAALEAYQPDIPYNGSWDDASVRGWVMSLIETGQ